MSNKIKHYIFLLFIIFSLNGFCQEITVKEFKVMSNDLTARTSQRLDLNGKPCGLIKVRAISNEVKFSGIIIGKVIYNTSEYWVYMPNGSKSITISIPGLLPLDITFADYGIDYIESNTTYNLTILENKPISESNTEWLVEEGIKCYEKKDYKTSIILFSKAAQQQDSIAEFYMGSLYDVGLGVNKDVDTAFKWYKKSAEHGYSIAQNNLAYFFENGIAVNKDINKAKHWYQMAVNQNYTPAIYNLGYIYVHDNSEQNIKKGVGLYQKGALMGSSDSQKGLGYCYYLGIGVEKNYQLAMKWTSMAAEQGNSEALYNMGTFYSEGIGCTIDKQKSHDYYVASASKGNALAKWALSLDNDSIKESMTKSLDGRIIKNPNVMTNCSSCLKINSVIIGKTKTILNVECNNALENGSWFTWVTLDKNSYIQANNKKYKLIKANGIAITPEKTMLQYHNQTIFFSLEFPAIPRNTKSIDFIESLTGDWRIYGIELK